LQSKQCARTESDGLRRRGERLEVSGKFLKTIESRKKKHLFWKRIKIPKKQARLVAGKIPIKVRDSQKRNERGTETTTSLKVKSENAAWGKSVDRAIGRGKHKGERSQGERVGRNRKRGWGKKRNSEPRRGLEEEEKSWLVIGGEKLLEGGQVEGRGLPPNTPDRKKEEKRESGFV